MPTLSAGTCNLGVSMAITRAEPAACVLPVAPVAWAGVKQLFR